VPAASTALPRALAGVCNLTISALRLAGRADVTAADNHRRRLLPRHVRAPPAGPPQPPREAARLLRADAHGGKLDPAAVEAVLTSAGHPTRRPAAGPAGLTQREVQVLVLLARAATTRQIARRLGITPKAAGNHIERIYTQDVRLDPSRRRPLRDPTRPSPDPRTARIADRIALVRPVREGV